MTYSLWLVSDRTQGLNGQPDLCWCWTYAAHQSTCRCRRPPEQSRLAESSGMSSICLPDFAGRPCHSDWKQKEPRFEPCGIPRLRQSGIRQSGIRHPAELADARVGGLPQPLGLHRRLTEKEKHLVVIRVFAFRDPERADKLWFWRWQEVVQRQTSAVTVTLRMIVYTTSYTDHSASASRAARCEWTAVSPCFWRWWNLSPSSL